MALGFWGFEVKFYEPSSMHISTCIKENLQRRSWLMRNL